MTDRLEPENGETTASLAPARPLRAGENRTGYGFANVNPDEWAGRRRVPPPKRNSKIDKWVRWMDRIEDEAVEIATNRGVFRDINQILDANPDIPDSDFFPFWAGNYGRSQAVAVRRQTDVSGQSITLGHCSSR